MISTLEDNTSPCGEPPCTPSLCLENDTAPGIRLQMNATASVVVGFTKYYHVRAGRETGLSDDKPPDT